MLTSTTARPINVAHSFRKFFMLTQFLQEEEGQTLVEYGLLISLIALVVIGVLTVFGAKIKNTFNKAADNMNAT